MAVDGCGGGRSIAIKREDDEARCCCIGEIGTNAMLGLAISRAATVATENFILFEDEVISTEREGELCEVLGSKLRD